MVTQQVPLQFRLDWLPRCNTYKHLKLCLSSANPQVPLLQFRLDWLPRCNTYKRLKMCLYSANPQVPLLQFPPDWLRVSCVYFWGCHMRPITPSFKPAIQQVPLLQFRLDWLREAHQRLQAARETALERPLPSAFITFRCVVDWGCVDQGFLCVRLRRRLAAAHPNVLIAHAICFRRDRWSAVVAATSLHTHDELCWRLRPAPNPDAIIWRALRMRLWERRCGSSPKLEIHLPRSLVSTSVLLEPCFGSAISVQQVPCSIAQ